MAQINVIHIEIGGRIAALRKKAQLSQGQLAGAVSLTRTSIVNIEKGRQHLTVYNLIKICSVLKCNIKDVIPKIPTATLKEAIKKTKVVESITMAADFKW